MLPSTSVGGGVFVETHRVSVNMGAYPGAVYTPPSSTFFGPTFNSASMEWRKTVECEGCSGAKEVYSTPTFAYSSEEKLAGAGAFTGTYRVSVTGGNGTYNGTQSFNRQYTSVSNGVLKIWIKAAQGGAPLPGVTVRIESLHQAVGSLTYTATADGSITATIPATHSYRVTVSGSSGGASVTSFTALVQVVAGGTPNKFTFSVISGGTGGTAGVVADPANPTPNTTTDTPPSAGGEYDGPPGQKSWWVEMLEDAFVPQSATLDQWAELWDDMCSWGPLGFAKGVLEAWTASGGHPVEPMANLVYSTSIGGTYSAETGQFAGGAPFVLDFRVPGTDPQTGNPIGSVYGTMRATIRQVLGWLVWGLTAWTFFRWLRPRLGI
jgi:hypothetical protein